MSTKFLPDYFDRVKQEASQRWEYLEKYPDVAAPWHQLFRQIQSPRHVISELLQNADDVGATWASVEIKSGKFIFRHNGDDFNEDNFRSLCRFGYSNKRVLHTIGFRGIGFKSTFSLGSPVIVTTPTLSVAFHKNRFTEPGWVKSDVLQEYGVTSITVQVNEQKVLEYLHENMQLWVDNPLPLLFFQNIKSLTFANQRISRKEVATGPINNSVWVELTSKKTQKLLLISSGEEIVPEAVLNEIRDERGDTEFDVPPCNVWIICGLDKQQLYTILPTNVNLRLPFSINGPFIQDPARMGIKDPLRSPLNTWLLERAGRLAASAMLNWVSNQALSREDAAEAYSLLPEKHENADSISGYCEKIVLNVFDECIRERPVLLTNKGHIGTSENCIDIDPELLYVWDDSQLAKIFGGNKSEVIALEVSKSDRKRLSAWNLLQLKSHSAIYERLLEDPPPPKPGLKNLKALWVYINSHMRDCPNSYWRKKDLRIVPAKNKKVLYSADQVNVLGAKEKQLTDEEYDFLEDHIIVLDPEWAETIQKSQTEIDEKGTKADEKSVAIHNLYSELRLNKGITIESVIRQVSQSIFAIKNPGIKGFRIAHITSRLGIIAPNEFKYYCQDGKWHEVSEGILMPGETFLELLYPENILLAHLISDDYEKDLQKDEAKKWREWILSEKSRLRKFLLPDKQNSRMYGKERVVDFCKQRNGNPPTEYRYKSTAFYVTDFDFPDLLWKHWEELAKDDPNAWTYLIYQIIIDWHNDWGDVTTSKVQQETNAYFHSLDHGKLTTKWIEQLKRQKCLPDTYSKPRFPGELLRNTPDTSALIRIEAFVHPDYDVPAAAEFLDLLGVRNKPTDPTKIIDRIRTISSVTPNQIILQETANLYDALDRVVLRMSSQQVEAIQSIFQAEKLVLSGDLSWHYSSAIFQANPDQIPGVPSIHSFCANLNLWDRLKINKNPSLDDAINWLNGLPSREVLSSKDKERAKAITQRVPDRVWNECHHWINMQSQWMPCSDLSWAVEKPKQIDYLFSWVKEGTADLSMLENPLLILQLGNLERLEAVLEHRLSNYAMSRYVSNPEWIDTIASNLVQVKSVKQSDSFISTKLSFENIQEQAKRLAETRFMFVNVLNVTPYIDGQPAGFQSTVKALWHGLFLYVYDDRINSHREIVQTVSAVFIDPVIRESIKDCVGRDRSWIDGYFSAYFDLGDPEEENLEGIESESPSGTSEEESDDIVPDDVVVTPPIDEGGENEKPDDDEQEELEVRKKRRKALRPEEKFAIFIEKDEFRWRAENKIFYNPNGMQIHYTEGLFPWVQYDSSGYQICSYRIEEGSFTKGLTIRADLFELMRQMPDFCCLVLHEDRTYRKVFFKEIDELLHENMLVIQPAAYWIKQTTETDQDDISDLS